MWHLLLNDQRITAEQHITNNIEYARKCIQLMTTVTARYEIWFQTMLIAANREIQNLDLLSNNYRHSKLVAVKKNKT